MTSLKKYKERIFSIIQIGQTSDTLSRFFDIFIVFVIGLNLFVTLADTFDGMACVQTGLDIIELITIIIFTIEYLLRLWTVEYLYPNEKRVTALFHFIFSFYGIIDLLTFLPYYLPIVFPAGIVAFRMLRVIRIFRLFKINAKYDAFNVITDVLKEKKSQLLSSICLILIMMVASSLFMYSLEHNAQPQNFSNAFSGIWWATSTLLTVGYGDIYPITIGGKIMAIVISFLGVGMVAIPTGIISAGFVEQYTKIKQMETYAEEKQLKFITSEVTKGHAWAGKEIREIVLPPEFLLVTIVRDGSAIVPKGDTILLPKDELVFVAKHYDKMRGVALTEIIIKDEHEWIDKEIKEIDISRRELIVMIQRGNRRIIPNGSTQIKKGDVVIMYSHS